MDTAQFRKSFPEFNDIVRYPDDQLNFWATVAEMQVDADRWGTMAPKGVFLYVAHEITLAAQNAKAGAVGGTPGGTSGPVNTKTVGSVSVGYDTAAATEKDAGWWNLTSYGKQFIRLARMFGVGAVQLA